MNVVVIVPTYNERENILTLLEALHESAKKISNHMVSFLVVDDTSPDGTKKVVEQYQKYHDDVYIITGKKEGLGKALLRGMTYAFDEMHADIVVQMDADLSHDPKHLPEFLSKIDNGADFVVGSRYIPGGSIPGNWGWHRKLFSIIGNAVVRFGLGYISVHDWTGGYRAYKRKYYDKAKSDMRVYSGYVFQIAFLHKAMNNGAHVEEVPIQFTDRMYGHSKIAPSEYIRNVLQYVFRERLQSIIHGTFGKFAVVGFIGFVINTVILFILVRFGLHPALASACGAEMAIISNFVLNNQWTFHERKIKSGSVFFKFVQFNLTSLGALGLQSGTVYLGTRIWGLQWYFPSYIVGVCIGLIWNYLMYSLVIWKKVKV